jgi:succinyl-CoA synthetase beta subunit
MNSQVKRLIAQPGPLAENEVKELLKLYGIPTTNFKVVRTEEDLGSLALRYPVALKVCSRKILHKTDVGGVKLGVRDLAELRAALAAMRTKFPGESFLVEEMKNPGVEIIIGLVQDPSFGLCEMVGIGGIFTELYKDVTFRVVPVTHQDAEEMMDEIRGKKLFEGFRHIRADKEAIVDLIVKISCLGEDLINEVDQLDLNPVFVYADSVCVVDAKMIVKKQG